MLGTLIAATPSSPTPSVRIEAFGHAGSTPTSSARPSAVITGTTPALLALQQSARVPYFDGDDRKWVEFARQWVRYSAYAMLGAPEGPLGDTLRRDLLVNCLHGTLHKRYATWTLQEPALTYAQIWADLERNFSVDDPNHWRRQWAGVTLRKGGKFGEDIKLMDLLAFRSEFEVARSFVQDWTQQEEMNLLMQQLPTKWRQRALRREAEEARRTHLVKLQNVDLDQMKLGQVLQHLGLHVVGINMLAGCRHVQLGSDADVQKLFGIPNLLIDGKRVSCQAIRSRWTSERLFSYLQDELRVEQESLVLGGRGNFTGSSPSPPWRPRQAGPQQQQQQPSKVEEIKTAAPRQPDRRPHPAAVAKPRSDAATAGSAKPAASKTPTFTPNSPCWTCERAGRPADHSFKACNHARDAYMKRPQRGLPKPKGH